MCKQQQCFWVYCYILRNLLDSTKPAPMNSPNNESKSLVIACPMAADQRKCCEFQLLVQSYADLQAHDLQLAT